MREEEGGKEERKGGEDTRAVRRPMAQPMKKKPGKIPTKLPKAWKRALGSNPFADIYICTHTHTHTQLFMHIHPRRGGRGNESPQDT